MLFNSAEELIGNTPLLRLSNIEKELVEFCKQYYPGLKENDRELIKPYELDIVIPEKKLAIEFNR